MSSFAGKTFDVILGISPVTHAIELGDSLRNAGFSTLQVYDGKDLIDTVREYTEKAENVVVPGTNFSLGGIGVAVFDIGLPLGKKPDHLEDYRRLASSLSLSENIVIQDGNPSYGGLYACMRITAFRGDRTKRVVIVDKEELGVAMKNNLIVDNYITRGDLILLPEKIRELASRRKGTA